MESDEASRLIEFVTPFLFSLFSPLPPSITSETIGENRGGREGKKEESGMEKKRNDRGMEWQKLDEGWNDIGYSPSIYITEKWKFSFGYILSRAIFNKGHLNRSTNRRFSFDSAMRFARAHIHTYTYREENEWLLGIYQVGTRVPGMERFIRQTGTILFPNPKDWVAPFSFFSFLFFSLFPCFFHLEQWNLKYGNGTLLAFPLLSPLFFRNVDKIAVVCYFNELLLLN